MDIKQRLAALRARYPVLDHAIRTQEHVGETQAGQQAGAITYYGFVSVFPVLALAFAVVGFWARWVPEVQDALATAVESLVPGVFGSQEGQIPLSTVEENAPGIASVGVLVVLWSGLGWMSAMRTAMHTVFEPRSDEPGFVAGKIRDLVSLGVIGVILLATVAVAGVVGGASEWLLGFVPLDLGQEWILQLISVALGVLANTVLFFAIFQLLARPDLPRSSLWSGALLGAVGFEVLKQAATYLLAATREQPAFQVFGMALILVVWINYFARLLMYAAAWAYTTDAARRLRVQDPVPQVQGPGLPSLDVLRRVHDDRVDGDRDEGTPTSSRSGSRPAILGAALGVLAGALVTAAAGRRSRSGKGAR